MKMSVPAFYDYLAKLSSITPVCEGIEVIPEGDQKWVKITQKYQLGMDTSIENNPSKEIYPETVHTEACEIVVYSIFKRNNKLDKDGNPLIYALKNENNYCMSTNDKEYLWDICRKITQKIVNDICSTESIEENVFVAVPSTNRLNNMIYENIKGVIPNPVKLTGVLRKLNPANIKELLLNTDGFHEMLYKAYDAHSGSSSQTGQEPYISEALEAFDEAFNEQNGAFVRHKLPLWLRPIVKKTMEISPEFKKEVNAAKITGKNLIIIDDTIKYGNSIKEAYKLLAENFEPKSMHCITLCSSMK